MYEKIAAIGKLCPIAAILCHRKIKTVFTLLW